MSQKLTMAAIWPALNEEQKKAICKLLVDYTGKKYVHVGTLALMKVSEVVEDLMRTVSYAHTTPLQPISTARTFGPMPSAGMALGTATASWGSSYMANPDYGTVIYLLASIGQALTSLIETRGTHSSAYGDEDDQQANYG